MNNDALNDLRPLLGFIGKIESEKETNMKVNSVESKIAIVKEIKEFRLDISRYDLEGDLDKAISFLQKIKKDNPKYHRFNLEIGIGNEIEVWSFRYETEEEYAKRIAKSRKARIAGKKAAKVSAEKRRQKELELFKRLQKKFANIQEGN